MIKRPMIIALIAYVLTECMAYANCSINVFVIIYAFIMFLCIIKRRHVQRKIIMNNKKAEQNSVSAFICAVIIIFLSGVLGYNVMGRGVEIKEEIYRVYKPARNDGNFDERSYELSIQNIFFNKKSVNKNSHKNEEKDGKNNKIGFINPIIYPKNDNFTTFFKNNVSSFANNYMKKLSRIKAWMGRKIDNNCDKKTATIYRALLIGDKKSIMEDDKLTFRIAGISHIFAISGLHISLLGIGLYSLLRKKFMMPFSVSVSIFLIVNYSLMIGISVSTTRAIVMFALRMIAEVCGRKYDEINGYIISLIIVSSIYPWGFTGFSYQMSFAAVGVCYFIIPKVIDFLKINSGLVKTIISGMILNMFLSILVAINYYEVYPYTVLTNIIILPFMGIVIVLGFLGLFKIGGGLINLGFGLCGKITDFKYSRIICGKPEVWQIIILIVIILVYIMYIRTSEIMDEKIKIKTGDFNDYKDEKKTAVRKWFCTGIIYAAVFANICFGIYIKDFIIYHFNVLEPKVKMVMVDVGQGDFFYVKTKDGVNVTIDGGSSDIKDVAKYRMVPFLKYRGVSTIDYAFISHGDDDHNNGIMDIITNYDLYGIRISNLIVTKLDNMDESLERIIDTANAYGVNVIRLEEGDKLLDFTCVMPYKELVYEDTNEASMVLSYEDDGMSALFTGDYNYDEEYLLKNIRKYTDVDSYTILKVAHHGSKFSTTDGFLEKIDPEYAWISCGVKNRYGHPAGGLLDRISKNTSASVYVTKEVGEVEYIK